MANIESVKLKMVYDGGLVNGKVKMVNKTYTGINPEISPENLNTIAGKIIEMQNKAIIKVVKIDETQINA